MPRTRTPKPGKETEAPIANPAEAAAPSAEGMVPAPADNPTVPEASDAPSKPVKGEIMVKFRDHQGKETSRTFSKEVHGADFEKLAEEFKQTNALKLI